MAGGLIGVSPVSEPMAEFDKLVEAFAYHVEAQTWEIFNGNRSPDQAGGAA